MSSKIKPLSIAIGAAFIGSLALGQAQAANPFQLEDLTQGYQLVSAEGSCGEGSCGEGEGEGDGEEGSGEEGSGEEGSGEEGSCGEGRCGEGKCGA